MLYKQIKSRKSKAIADLKAYLAGLEKDEDISPEDIMEATEKLTECLTAEAEFSRLGLTDESIDVTDLLDQIKAQRSAARIEKVKQKVNGYVGVGLGVVGNVAGSLLGSAASIIGNTGAVISNGLNSAGQRR